MICNLYEYLDSQNEMFDEFDEVLPQLDKIEKANIVCDRLLQFIDSSVDSIDFEAFEEIKEQDIAQELNIKINKEISKDMLLEIYKEIEDSFALKGRVSIKEYMEQGNLIYDAIQNSLAGNVDYSIAYSEEELKKKEKEAFIRFSIVNSMTNLVQMKDMFSFSDKGKELINRNELYINKLSSLRKPETVEEKIADLNYTLLALETLSKTNSRPIEERLVDINEVINEKLANITENFSQYKNDTNIRRQYIELNTTLKLLNNEDSHFSQLYQEVSNKLTIMNEAFYGKKTEKEKQTASVGLEQ